MAYTIKSDIEATRIVVQGKTVGAGISTTDNSIVYTANTAGHVDLPIPTSSEIDYIFNQFPLSQYGAINNDPIGVSGTDSNTGNVPQGFYIYFTEITPLFMSGQYFDVPISVIDLNDVTSSPQNKSYYIYIQLILGTPKYVASLSEIPESATTMFIGTVTTDGTKVSVLNINKVSRFDLYRPSLTQIGSAFPVSSGNPAQTGSIGW